MHLPSTFLLLAALVSSSGLYAESLSLSDAISAARQNNGDVKVATLTLNQTTRSNDVNDLLPSISLEVGASGTGSVIDETFTSSYSVGGISWSLDTANLSTNRKARALSNQAANLTYQSTLSTVESNVTTAYWNVVAARLALQSKQDTLDRAQDELERIQEKYEAAQATTLSVSTAKMTVSDDKYNVQTARQTLETAIRTLSHLTGLAVTDETKMDPMPETVNLLDTETLEADLEKTITMQQKRLAVSQAQNNVDAEKASGIAPKITISASTSFSGGIYSSDSGDSSWWGDSKGGDFTDSTSVGVTVSIPLDHLLKKSSTSAAIDAAKIGVSIAQQEYENQLTTLKDDVEDAIVSLSQATANLATLKQHLELAEEQLALLQESYDAGKTSYSDLQDAKDDVSDSRINILQQQLNQTIALYDLSALLNKSVDEIITDTKV